MTEQRGREEQREKPRQSNIRQVTGVLEGVCKKSKMTGREGRNELKMGRENNRNSRDLCGHSTKNRYSVIAIPRLKKTFHDRDYAIAEHLLSLQSKFRYTLFAIGRLGQYIYFVASLAEIMRCVFCANIG